MRIILATTFLFFCQSILSAENLQDLDWLTEIEYQKESGESKYSEKIDFSKLQSLQNEDYFQKRRDLLKEPPFKERDAIFRPRPFHAAIRKGANLVHVDTHQSVSTPRIIYVIAEEVVTGGDITLIYDKKGKIKYETLTNNVSSIEQDLDMGHRPGIFRIEHPPEDFAEFDKILKTKHILRLNNEFITDPFSSYVFSSYTNTIRPGDQLQARALRLEYSGTILWHFPIEFGPILSYQGGSWKGNALGLHWNALEYGFNLQKDFPIKKWDFHFHTALLKSKFFNISSDNNNADIKYSTYTLQVGLEWIWRHAYGQTSFGPSLRKSRVTVEETDRAVNLPESRLDITTISLNISQTFNFDYEY